MSRAKAKRPPKAQSASPRIGGLESIDNLTELRDQLNTVIATVRVISDALDRNTDTDRYCIVIHDNVIEPLRKIEAALEAQARGGES